MTKRWGRMSSLRMVNWKLILETSHSTPRSLRKPKLMLSMSRTSTMSKSRSTRPLLLRVSGSLKKRRNKIKRRMINLSRTQRDPLRLWRAQHKKPSRRSKRNLKCPQQSPLRIANPMTSWSQRLRPKLPHLRQPRRKSPRKPPRPKLRAILNQKMSSPIKSPQLPNRNKKSNPSQKMRMSTIHRPSPLKNLQQSLQVTTIIRNITKSIRNNIIIKAKRACILAINTKKKFNHWPSIKLWSKVPKKRTRRTLRKLRQQ